MKLSPGLNLIFRFLRNDCNQSRTDEKGTGEDPHTYLGLRHQVSHIKMFLKVDIRIEVSKVLGHCLT